MLILINRHMRRAGRSALAFVVLAVLAAHSAIAGDHMGHDGGMDATVVMCLAVADTAAAVFVAATLLGPLARMIMRWAAPTDEDPGHEDVRRLGPPPGRSRDGPLLQVFVI